MSGFDSFESMIRRGRRVQCVAAALIDRALAQPVVRLVLVKGDRKLVLSRNLDGACAYRVTSFDEHGPSGHREYRASDRHGCCSLDSEFTSAIRNGWRNERRIER